jgi:Na+/H+ antiporter NhaC
MVATSHDRGADGALIGVGAALGFVLLVVLQAITGGALLGSKAVTAIVTTEETAPPQYGAHVVSNLYLEHMLLLESRKRI